MAAKRIIVLGGGFAGVECAKRLRRKLPQKEWEIVVFNRENHMVFHPLLAEVAGASINPDAVAAPLRQMLPGVRARTEEVEQIHLESNEIEFKGEGGRLRRMAYDQLVVAVGAAVNLAMVPGMADHAFPLKTIGDAMALRAHVMHQLERAEVCDNEDRRRWYLSFVIVGGGFSGVEAAGELNDLARGSARFFRNFIADDIQVTLIHSRDQILPEVIPTLREFARKMMSAAGIRMVLNSRVMLATPEGVGLKTGEMVRGATIVCTIGTTSPAVVARLEAPKEQARLKTGPDMRLQGRANVWAVGDCASIVNAQNGQLCPTTAQFALRQGKQLADNIARAIAGKPTEPFRFKEVGQLCSIGGHTAVAEMFGIQLSGFVAWFLWRSVYLFKMPSLARKFKVGLDWTWDLFFARDLAFVKTSTSERVSRAYYKAGDFVFHAGDPATSFYVVEKGQVEVVRPEEGSKPEEILAVLGPGDFFGEMALIDKRPRTASVRARSPIEVVVVGSDVFSQLSGALTPLRNIVAEAAKRRGSNIWLQVPFAQRFLNNRTVGELIDSLPPEHLTPQSRLADAVRLFGEKQQNYCLVLGADGSLDGILTRHELMHSIEVLAKLPMDGRRNLCVKDFMLRDPTVLTAQDSALLAAATMRDHHLAVLPVLQSPTDRRVVGVIRIGRLMYEVLRHVDERGIPAGESEGIQEATAPPTA